MDRLPYAPFGELQVAEKTLLTYVNFHYNINTELVTPTVSNGGSVTQAASAAVLATSTASNGSARIESRLPARYIAGQGLIVIFSAIFGSPQAGNVQEAGYGGVTDGFLFDYNGTTFNINRRTSTSGSVVNNREPSTAWSLKENLPEFNPLKYNVFAVSFQWLGAGEIVYWIESRQLGLLVPVHKIKFANSNEVLSLLNPSLPLYANAANSGNASDVTLKIGNMAAYVFGKREMVGPRQAHRVSLAYTTGAERTVLAIENMASVFGGTTNNRSILAPDHFSFSTDGTKSVTLRIKRCTISGGTNAVINANTSLAKQYTGTPTISNEKLLFAVEAAKIDQGVIDLPDDVLLAPGEAILVTAESTSNSDITSAFGWKELL